MISTIRTKLASLTAALLLVALPLAAPVAVYALDDVQNGVCSGAGTLKISDNPTTATCDTDNTATTKVNDTITTVINIFSTLVGVIAVIMIIYGGMRYITSGGDSGKITSAKNTIIYALIGLVVVALAQFIVKFVLNKVTSTPA
jgi:energy-converting hydrogenase Eha subunit B